MLISRMPATLLITPINLVARFINPSIKGYTRGAFRSVHASNYLSIDARFPQDKKAVLKTLDQALAADIAPKQKLGLYMGTLNMAVMLGLGIGPVLGGTIRDYFGMNAAFYAMGGLALLTCILVLIFIPSEKKTHGRKKKPRGFPWEKC